jgi:Protein of unknown function (DUF1614)
VTNTETRHAVPPSQNASQSPKPNSPSFADKPSRPPPLQSAHQACHHVGAKEYNNPPRLPQCRCCGRINVTPVCGPDREADPCKLASTRGRTRPELRTAPRSSSRRSGESDALSAAFGAVLCLPGGGISRRPRAHPDRHPALRLLRIGISSRAAMFLLLGSLFGSYINIPVAQLPEREVQSGVIVNFFGMQYVVPQVVEWPDTVIAVNVGGAKEESAD